MKYDRAMSATLTLSCKLKVTEAQTAKLTATLSAFTQALNWVNAHTDPAQSYRNGKKFKCGHCGWEGDADFNSAKVIALLGAVVNQPRGEPTARFANGFVLLSCGA